MSSIVRSILGAALLLIGTSAVMAASNTAPITDKSRQIGASTAAVASSNVPVAAQPAQTTASTAAPATTGAIVEQPRKSAPKFSDNNDAFGGNDPNSSAGIRAFFTPQY